jgi:hypothetical protein
MPYIRGTGLEVMTSSDNVIRLGLTGKPVFVDQAIAALDFDAQPQVLATRHGDLIWPVDAPFVVPRCAAAGSGSRGRVPHRPPDRGQPASSPSSARCRFDAGPRRSSRRPIPTSFVEADGLVAVIQSTER